MTKSKEYVKNRALSDDDSDDEQQAAVIPNQHSEEDDDGDESKEDEKTKLTRKKKDKKQASADTNNWFNDMMTDKEQVEADQQIKDVLGNLNVESDDESDEQTIKSSTVKRRLNLDDKNTAATTSPDKKVKVVGGEASGEKKTMLFTKIFKNDDEIVLLEEFIKFKSQTRSDDLNKFLQETEGKLTLSFTASHSQLREKMRRFKDKYLAQVVKGHIAFSDPHLDLVYHLSHKAFGPADDADYWTFYPKLCRSIELEAIVHFPVMAYNVKKFVKMTIFKLGEKKAKKLEEEWDDYSAMELQLFAKRIQVLSKQTRAVADVLRNGSLSID